MNTTIKNLIIKYGVLILFNSIIGYFWFHCIHLLYTPIPIELSKQELMYSIPSFISYFIQLIVCILLILDIRKYSIRFWLIPVIGLFYPVFGVAVFLILYILQKKENIENHI
jgi:hypothetical protein